MHMPEFVSKTFTVSSDILSGVLGGLIAAIAGPKVAALFKAATNPKEGGRNLGEALGETAVRPPLRETEVVYLRLIVQVEAPEFYNLIEKANEGWGLLRDATGKVFYNEDRLWGNLKVLYDSVEGTKKEKEAAFRLELHKFEEIVKAGDFKKLMGELGTLEDDRIIQRAAFIFAKVEEHWPAVRTAYNRAHAEMQIFGGNETDKRLRNFAERQKTSRAEFKERKGWRRWFA